MPRFRVGLKGIPPRGCEDTLSKVLVWKDTKGNTRRMEPKHGAGRWTGGGTCGQWRARARWAGGLQRAFNTHTQYPSMLWMDELLLGTPRSEILVSDSIPMEIPTTAMVSTIIFKVVQDFVHPQYFMLLGHKIMSGATLNPPEILRIKAPKQQIHSNYFITCVVFCALRP